MNAERSRLLTMESAGPGVVMFVLTALCSDHMSDRGGLMLSVASPGDPDATEDGMMRGRARSEADSIGLSIV